MELELATMPRHTQPIEIAQLKGAVKKDPQRYRRKPPEVLQVLGNAPDHLSEKVQACWFELSTYAPVQVLKGADRVSLELLSGMLAEYRVNPSEYPANKIGLMISLLARLGMTPSDRQKIGAEPVKDKDPFQAF